MALQAEKNYHDSKLGMIPALEKDSVMKKGIIKALKAKIVIKAK